MCNSPPFFNIFTGEELEQCQVFKFYESAVYVVRECISVTLAYIGLNRVYLAARQLHPLRAPLHPHHTSDPPKLFTKMYQT